MSKVTLIDFYATWCGPCKMQDPIIEKLKEKLDGKVEFKKVNVDEEDGNKFAQKYSIHAIPTLIITKDDELFSSFVGVTKAEILEKKLREALEEK